jgi:RAQPRD family integrative conjugative element protein
MKIRYMKSLPVYFFLFLSFILTPLCANADTDLENEDLIRIIQVLNSLTPIIDEAKLQQDKNTRIQFQYDRLQSDIQKIKAGIEEKLHKTTMEPRVVTPISGDYLTQKTIT